MTQPIDLIALDLDGTLLRPDESISDVNRAAIARALKSGIRVVLVTGRGVDTPIRVSRELGLNLPVICCHGALTKDFGANKTLQHVPVPLEYAKPMLEFAERAGVHIAVYAEEMFWRPTGSHVYMQDMIGPGWREVPSLLDALKTGAPTFIRFLGTPAIEAMQREFGDLPLTYLYESWHDFIECVVLNRDANKKNALIRLCADFQIPSERVLAVGDSRNDVPMLHLVRHRRGDGQRPARSAPSRALRDRRQCERRRGPGDRAFLLRGGEEDGLMQPAAPTPEYEDTLRDLLNRRDWQALREHSRTLQPDSRRRLQHGPAFLGSAAAQAHLQPHRLARPARREPRLAREARLHDGSRRVLMALRVLAFARLRELLGFGERTLDVGPAATLEDVWTTLDRGLARSRAHARLDALCAQRRVGRRYDARRRRR